MHQQEADVVAGQDVDRVAGLGTLVRDHCIPGNRNEALAFTSPYPFFRSD